MKAYYRDSFRKMEKIKNNEIAELKLRNEESTEKIQKLMGYCQIFEANPVPTHPTAL